MADFEVEVLCREISDNKRQFENLFAKAFKIEKPQQKFGIF